MASKRKREKEQENKEKEPEKIEPEEEKVEMEQDQSDVKNILVQFKSAEGEIAGGVEQLSLDLDSKIGQLTQLINKLLSNEESRPYSFFLNEEEIKGSLRDEVTKQKTSLEHVVTIRYEPQAIWRVRAVTRCSATIQGHTEAVLHVHFSANGKKLASGSGDCTVRLWDVDTATPLHTLKGHKHWVLAVAWAPNCKLLASGDREGIICVWNSDEGKRKGKMLRGHKKAIMAIAWEPFLKNPKCTRFASASQDGTVKIWDVTRNQLVRTLSGHTGSVYAVQWGGSGLIYSSSHDRTIKVWEAETGKLVRSLTGHAHRVNALSLSTEYALRTGPFDQKGTCPEDEQSAVEVCKEKYKIALAGKPELLVSGSDDFTLYLWNPTVDKKPILRLTGHQQPINFVSYSPNGRWIASASFDKSVRIWDGRTGKFKCVLRGHVQAVYQVCWSSDSRLLVSGSKDSTIKVWNTESGKVLERKVTKKGQTKLIHEKSLLHDLPGHEDEVYAVDWSPDGALVASGGKDRVLKLWRR